MAYTAHSPFLLLRKKSQTQTQAKQLKIMHGSYAPVKVQPKNVRRTLTGTADKTFSVSYWTWSMVAKIYYTDTSPWCSLSDLETFLTTDVAVDNILTLTDFSATEYDVVSVSDYAKQNVIPVLNGALSYYLIPIQLEQV